MNVQKKLVAVEGHSVVAARTGNHTSVVVEVAVDSTEAVGTAGTGTGKGVAGSEALGRLTEEEEEEPSSIGAVGVEELGAGGGDGEMNGDGKKAAGKIAGRSKQGPVEAA